MHSPFVILFAAPIGSSKTPLAHVLSSYFALPIVNNDALRIQTTVEQQGTFDQHTYIEKRNTVLKKLFESNTSFIYDASIDRHWQILEQWLKQFGYAYYIISLDLSPELLNIQKKGEKPEHIAQTIVDHTLFLQEYQSQVNLHITDETFPDRFNLARQAIEDWIALLDR